MAARLDYDDILIHPGRYLTAEWYYAIEGDMPAREYYQAMGEKEGTYYET